MSRQLLRFRGATLPVVFLFFLVSACGGFEQSSTLAPATVVDLPASSSQPVAVQTELEPSRTPDSPLWTPAPPPFTPNADAFQGAVQIQNGFCCAGGPVGTVLDLTLSFSAYSPDAELTEMRLKTDGICFTEADLSDQPWQPYRSHLRLAYPVSAINWVGMFVTVQFRDALGNVSSVACDDIAIEGMPAAPTPGELDIR